MNRFPFYPSVIYGVLFSTLICIAAQVIAQSDRTSNTPPVFTESPADLIHVAIVDVMTTMRNNEGLYKDHPEKFQEVTEKIILPYLNISHMAQLAMGKNWKNMDDAQRKIIVNAFQSYLIKRYMNTLYSYRYSRPEIVDFTDNSEIKTNVKVIVNNEAGNPITLFVRLEKITGKWQILDISVEGVSLIITSRGQFDEEINKQGIGEFIHSFSEENKSGYRSEVK